MAMWGSLVMRVLVADAETGNQFPMRCWNISESIIHICPFFRGSNKTQLGEEDVGMSNAKLGEGVFFERIRRITGYLVGAMNRWNDAKKAEEKDRVKHGIKQDVTSSGY